MKKKPGEIAAFAVIVFVMAFYLSSLAQREEMQGWFDLSASLLLLIGLVGVSVHAFLGYKWQETIGFKIVSFLLLFLLYVLRSPDDFFQPYLWAEDGGLILQNAVYIHEGNILDSFNGTLWVLQRGIGYFSCWVVVLLQCFPAAPYVMGTISKLIAVSGIYYFTDKGFEWLVKMRLWRWLIGILVVLTIPVNAYDLVTCDTSLPFVLIFPMFLIGMRLLCQEKVVMLDWRETIFLCVFALSSAAAPFVAAFLLPAFLRWTIVTFKKGGVFRSRIFVEAIKVLLVMAAVLLQIYTILTSERTSNVELAIAERIGSTLKAFVFYPYWQVFQEWSYFAIGLISFMLILYWAGIPRRVVGYSMVFSFLFMLYCSMSYDKPEYFFDGPEVFMMGRFVYVNTAIATLLLGLVIHSFFKKDGIMRIGSIMMGVSILLLSAYTYHIPVYGAERIVAFETNSVFFDGKSENHINIPVGPTGFWFMYMPVSFPPEEKMSTDLVVHLAYVNRQNNKDMDIWAYIIQTADCSFVAETKGDAKVDDLILIERDGSYRSFKSTSISEQDAIDLTVKRKNMEDKPLHFTFEMDQDDFPGGETAVAFIARTTDGKFHKGYFDLNDPWQE